MAAERGLEVDHTTIYRRVIKFTLDLEKAVRLIKRPAGKSWRLGKTGSFAAHDRQILFDGLSISGDELSVHEQSQVKAFPMTKRTRWQQTCISIPLQ